MSKDKVTVYWAPMGETTSGEFHDHSIAYASPELVYTELKRNINPMTAQTRSNLLVCPAVKDMFRNTYSFGSTASADYEIDGDRARSRKDYGIPISEMRPPSISNRVHLSLSLEWIFFSDEPLEMEITPPYFSDARHMAGGVIVPGKFDIGSWYRPVNAEFVLTEKAREFVLQPDEPIFYAKFLTDKKVELKKYFMTPELHALSQSCVGYRFTFGNAHRLFQHYDVFRKANLKKKILHNIQKNLIE